MNEDRYRRHERRIRRQDGPERHRPASGRTRALLHNRPQRSREVDPDQMHQQDPQAYRGHREHRRDGYRRYEAEGDRREGRLRPRQFRGPVLHVCLRYDHGRTLEGPQVAHLGGGHREGRPRPQGDRHGGVRQPQVQRALGGTASDGGHRQRAHPGDRDPDPRRAHRQPRCEAPDLCHRVPAGGGLQEGHHGSDDLAQPEHRVHVRRHRDPHGPAGQDKGRRPCCGRRHRRQHIRGVRRGLHDRRAPGQACGAPRQVPRPRGPAPPETASPYHLL